MTAIAEKKTCGLFYATTRISQKTSEGMDKDVWGRYVDDGVVWDEFKCDYDLEAIFPKSTNIFLAQEQYNQEAIAHLTYLLEEQDFDNELEVNLFGLTPEEFAKELVLKEKECVEKYGTIWSIDTEFEEADQVDWEHPCNL